MASPNQPLPPNIPGTDIDEVVYGVREGDIPLLKARSPLYILMAGFLMALATMTVAGVMSRMPPGLDEDERRERLAHALAVAGTGALATTTLLGAGLTALQVGGGERREPMPRAYYPAPPTLPMAQHGDRFELDPMRPATDPEPTEQPGRENTVGFLRDQVLPGAQQDYEERLARVKMTRIYANVENTLDGFQTPNDSGLRHRPDFAG